MCRLGRGFPVQCARPITPPRPGLRRVPEVSGSTVSATTSVTLPSHNAGDLIVIFAFDDNPTATVPSVPAASGTVPAWDTIDTYSQTSASCITAYFVATASNHTSGTWSGATGMIAVVLSGQGVSPIGGHAVTGGATSGTYSAAPSVTMVNGDGSSVLLHFYGHRLAPSWPEWAAGNGNGYTTQIESGEVCLDTKDYTTSDGAVQHSNNTSGAVRYAGATIEVTT